MNIEAMTFEDRKKIVREIRQYLSSPRGRRELIEAMERADETCRQMREASRVKLEDLYEPMTI